MRIILRDVDKTLVDSAQLHTEEIIAIAANPLEENTAVEEYAARVERFFDAVRNNEADLVAEMAKAEPRLLEERSTIGDTPLLTAVNGNRFVAAEALLKAGANPDALDRKKYSSLMIAADYGRAEMASLLLEWKATPDLQHEEYNITALHVAALNGNIEIINKLFEYKASLDLRGKYGETPLFYAVMRGNPEALKIFKQKGADINVRNQNNDSPLDYVIYEERKDSIFDLLLELGADFLSGNKDGTTPAFRAAQANNTHALEELKKRGAPLELPNNLGYTPLFSSALGKAPATAGLLLDWGLPINVTAKDGKKLRDAFAEAGLKDILARIDGQILKQNAAAVVAIVAHGLSRDTAAPERATFARKPRVPKNQPA